MPELAKVQLTEGVPVTEPADETPAPGVRAADRATVPGLARQAVAAGGRPVTVDLSVPPIPVTEPPREFVPARRVADRAKAATVSATEPTAPVTLRSGSRPDDATVEKTRALYREHRAAGCALTDRQLAAVAQAGRAGDRAARLRPHYQRRDDLMVMPLPHRFPGPYFQSRSAPSLDRCGST
ncbi:hypothetical protein [Actinomadura rubrisoli]|uniref:Uncharacterized protein n=1 Tax=Actinomadura rubrisoli TaxID=2530368 RepID=A0A4V2YYQ7_9ACTN|nr:hypothetical protein [Actinomadura rubrisoli]TDD94137.1 hypothetical protein E1298_07440 [Actinomadura rubrisoli]